MTGNAIEKYQLDIVYEDNFLVILNKPSDLLTIEDGYDTSKPNLRSMLKELFGNIWTVHRLDKKTSGLVIFAKNAETHKILNDQFQKRTINKQYRALSMGFPVWDQKFIQCPLKINGDRKHRTVIGTTRDKNALTKVEVIQRLKNHVFFQITPLTGITHQIRAHLSIFGFPIIGDDLYLRICKFNPGNSRKESLLDKYLYLQSYALTFAHPENQKSLSFELPIPNKFQDAISFL